MPTFQKGHVSYDSVTISIQPQNNHNIWCVYKHQQSSVSSSTSFIDAWTVMLLCMFTPTFQPHEKIPTSVSSGSPGFHSFFSLPFRWLLHDSHRNATTAPTGVGRHEMHQPDDRTGAGDMAEASGNRVMELIQLNYSEIFFCALQQPTSARRLWLNEP